MDEVKRKYITLGSIILGVVFVLFLAVYVVPQAFVSFTKAAPATKVSINDSYVLGETILAKADGKDKCMLNVFILDSSGKGVAGKNVSLEGMESVVAINSVTNNEGKASFSVTSSVEGQYDLTATVEGAPLTRGVKVTFRN
jgi:hypothetical protein